VEALTISFVGNLPGHSGGDTFVVGSSEDYCHISSLIRKDLASDLKAVWVRDSHLFSWLRSQIEHSGIAQHRPVEFLRKTPSSLLEDRWGVKVPAWLTDDLILTEGLLDKDLPSECTNAENGLLEPLFGALPDTLQAKFVGALAEKASEPLIEASLAKPVPAAAWQAILDRWMGVEKAPAWVGPCCLRLRSNPKTLWRDLTIWRLLRSYPEKIVDFALDPAVGAFVRTLPGETFREMKLNPEGRGLALDQIKQITAAFGSGVVTREKFSKFLEAVSGELSEEFTLVESLLDRADFDVAPQDIVEVRRLFANCEGISAARVSRLNLYVKPTKPDQIEKRDPDAIEWSRWAQEEYLPYRWWQIQRREADPVVESSVASFSNWYCRNYSLVHSDPAISAIQTITRWRERILADKVSLILLVDNLPWFFWELLEKALASAGLHRHEASSVFVPLPSHTSVSKPLLVSGQAGATGSEYQKMLNARSASEWQGRAVTYTMGVDQLGSFVFPENPSVVFLNYLAADEALHSDAEASGSSWSDQLDLLYGNLAKAVGDFARRAASSGGDFGLYVLTDHGSTLILPAERQAVDAQLTKNLFQNEKHRSATLSEAAAGQVPENLWKLGCRLVSPLTTGVHFIPRGHNTVGAAGNRLTFSHGGATPEEVIVPTGVFRLHSATWISPKLRFVDLVGGRATFYVKRIASLGIEIQNGNGDSIQLESLTISPEVAEIRNYSGVSIPAKGTNQTDVSLYFDSNATSTSAVIFTMTFRIGQDLLTQSIELPVTITSTTSGGLDLKDLF